MPQHRPPRVISRPTPLRVAGVGENPRQGARRGVDLHVARSLTVGRFPPPEQGCPLGAAAALGAVAIAIAAAAAASRNVVWCILIRTATFPTLRHASRGMSPARRLLSCRARHTTPP